MRIAILQNILVVIFYSMSQTCMASLPLCREVREKKTSWTSLPSTIKAIPILSNGEREAKIFQIGSEAYILAYPLVLMEMTKRVTTCVPFSQRARAPLNQLAHIWDLVHADYTDLPSPQADSLSTMAWLELEPEPMILNLPEIQGRFYLITLFDAGANAFYTKANSHSSASNMAIVGPGWKGSLPKGVTQIQAPCHRVWMRIQMPCNGTAKDVANINHLQQRLQLTPLSRYHKAYEPSVHVAFPSHIDVRTAPQEQIQKMAPLSFFKLALLLAKQFPELKESQRIQQLLLPLNLENERLDSTLTKGLQRAVDTCQKSAKQNLNGNGWTKLNDEDKSRLSLGEAPSEYVTSYYIECDQEGEKLNGAFHYRLQFNKDQLPPVHAFWSITAYNEDHFLMPNAFQKYAIHSLKTLKLNDEEGLDLYFQHHEPHKKQNHWLPVGQQKFNLILRLYVPKEASDWTPPPIQKFEPEFMHLKESIWNESLKSH